MLKFFGGLLLFFGGLEGVKRALNEIAENKVRDFLLTLKESPYLTAVAGVVITVVLQSSSAVSILLISMLDVDLLDFKTAALIMAGANLGTTVTVQFFSLSISLMSLRFMLLLLVLLFFLLKFLFDKYSYYYCFLFFSFFCILSGLDFIKSTFDIFWIKNFLINVMNTLPGIWFCYLFIGIGITVLLQSSSAVSGIVVTLLQKGILNFHQAVLLILGSNIGTCITAFLAAAGCGSISKKLAFFHLLFNTLGVCLILPLINDIKKISLLFFATPVRQLANFHFVFNLINFLLFVLVVVPLWRKKEKIFN